MKTKSDPSVDTQTRVAPSVSASHTPTPWTLSRLPGGTSIGIYAGRENAPITIAKVFELAALYKGMDGVTQANAEHIVRCVNAHDELVAALKAVLAPYDSAGNFGGDEWGHTPKTITAARAALAKLEGRT